MPVPGHIRVTEGDQAIFQEVLRSLESHHPAKAEKDILEHIREHFGLPRDIMLWPKSLVEKGVSTESFLDFVLHLMAPFVEMVLGLYGFFSKFVSTTGGRTTHFQITGEGHGGALNFPDVDFPRKVQWIQTWAEVQTQAVSIDWGRIANALIIDNGIFYGRVRDVRLLQSFIIARREGRLSLELRAAADRICEVLRRAVRAWFMMQRTKNLAETINVQPRWVRRAFVPALHSEMVQRGMMRPSDNYRYNVGVDVELALAGGARGYRRDEVFIDPDGAEVIELEGEAQDGRRDWKVDAAVFFIALWGLDEESFKNVAGLLTAHEDRDDLLRGDELDVSGRQLAGELVADLEAAIVPEGPKEKSIEEVRKKLEILLLPYWKDRWFLYEVWTLCFPLAEALSLNGGVELLGIKTIGDGDIQGTTWDLPTQKARLPVARLSGANSESSLLVWFQRETRSLTGRRNIEPDIRITLPWDPYADFLILECKDRVKFRRRAAKVVGQTYLDGSAAKVVWIVNYEDSTRQENNAIELQEQDGRQLGIAYNFRPGSISQSIRDSLNGILKRQLGLPQKAAQPKDHYLIIDASGSMDQKILPNLPLLRQLPQGLGGVYSWCDEVKRIPPENLAVIAPEGRLQGSGKENGVVLAEFASSLPENAWFTLITDETGKKSLESYLVPLKSPLQDPHYTIMISGRALELILL